MSAIIVSRILSAVKSPLRQIRGCCVRRIEGKGSHERRKSGPSGRQPPFPRHLRDQPARRRDPLSSSREGRERSESRGGSPQSHYRSPARNQSQVTPETDRRFGPVLRLLRFVILNIGQVATLSGALAAERSRPKPICLPGSWWSSWAGRFGRDPGQAGRCVH